MTSLRSLPSHEAGFREPKASAKKAAETKRQAKEDRVRWAQVADQWRKSEYHGYLPYSLPTMLRIDGD